MNADPEVSITLSAALYKHLRDEANRLGIPLEWLVASMVVDTFEEPTPAPALVPSA